MKSLVLALFALINLSGCTNPPNKKLSNEALLQRAREIAPAMVNYETVWSCAGRISDGSNEFITAAVQNDPQTSEIWMLVDRIVIADDGGSYSRWAQYMNQVEAIPQTDIPFVIYKQKLSPINSRPEDRTTVATYDFSAQTVLLNVIKFNNQPLIISCASGQLRY